MVHNKFNPYIEDDFKDINFSALDTEKFSDEYDDFRNIDTDSLDIFDTFNDNPNFKSSPMNSMIDSDFIPFNDVFASSVIPFGGGMSYEDKPFPNTQNIPQASTLLKDIKNIVAAENPEAIGNEPISKPLDINSQNPSPDKNSDDAKEIVDIYEIERILNTIEDKNPLIIKDLLSQNPSYPSMRILLRRIIILTLKYHYEK